MEREILGWLARVAPIALRVGGLLSFCPFVGDRAIPIRVKAGLLIVLTALLAPVVPVPPVSLAPVDWVRTVLGELLVGTLIGLSLQAVFDGMQFAGQAAGIQMGVSLATLFDPQSEADSTVIPVLFNLIALLIFLQLDVHHWVLRGLERSFEYLPVGTFSLSEVLTRDAVRVVGALFVLGIQIAAPLLMATLMIDLAMSFVSKASPQIPAMLLGLPVKNVASYLLLGGAVVLWPGLLERRFAVAVGAAEKMLHLVR